MARTRREFGALVMAGVGVTAIPSALNASTAAAQQTTEVVGTAAAQAAAEVPWGGPLAPDKPLAKAYADAAKALSEVDDNPMIRWQHRVWCQTGYRSPGSAGTGQPVDQLVDPAVDFVSPKGFLYKNYVRPMPEGGVQFLDNAWYFGTDFIGIVVVRTPDGLVMLDAMTNPQDMRTQFLDQAAAAGLDPRDIRHVFLGHSHIDHVGGASMVRGAEETGGQRRSSGRDSPRHRARRFLLRLPEAAETEGILNLAELRGGQDTRPLDQVVPGHGGQPRARGKAWTRERQPQHAFKGQSFQGAYSHFDTQTADVDARRSDDLHHPDPGRVVSRQQYEQPPLVELDPPDFATLHMSS
ncbi:MBL fold metallo-hydrolase [Streptomyces violaceus]|uniref:MBL fold metallo-hydrolase n=1 Tax=Streptomyces violaceus TaxID=1936 RepID=UPI0037FCF7B9